MYKRLLKKIRYLRFMDNYPRFRLGAFLVALFCVFMVIIATFTQVKLWYLALPENAFANPVDFFSNIKLSGDIFQIYYYIPQIPAILFTAALLGPRVGLISVAIYVLSGLIGLPIFASGGGISYYSDLGFGYILGYFVSVFLVGNILSKRITSLSLIVAAIVGVLAIHLTGILYLTVLMLIQHNSIFAIFGWIWAKSGMQIFWDLVIGTFAVGMARPARAIFWAAMD